MIFAGIHLDRAWTELGTHVGAELRRGARDILAHVIDEAHERNVETLVIAGGLLDRSTALPATVDYAAKVLGTFRGNVLIAPGPSDWIAGDGPYSYHDWPANTHVWTESEYAPSP